MPPLSQIVGTIGTIGAVASCSPCGTPLPNQVPEQLGRLEKLLHEAHETLGLLTDKINLILRPVPPCDPRACAGSPVPPRSEMASRIDSSGNQTYDLIGRMRELIGRVDL